MKAIILAAGQGVRLRPHTEDRPKGMVELLGKPMLQRQVATLRAAGIGDIVVVGGYRAERIDLAGVSLALNAGFESTNMVATLFAAEAHMTGGDDIIVGYGDIVYEERVLKALLECDAPIATVIDRKWRSLWALRMEDPLADAESLRLGEGDAIVEIGKKLQRYEDAQGQYIGLTRIRADAVATVKNIWHALDPNALYDGKTLPNMYMTSFLQYLIDTGVVVRAAFTDGGWIEVDTVDDLERYEAAHREGRLSSFIRLDS